MLRIKMHAGNEAHMYDIDQCVNVCGSKGGSRCYIVRNILFLSDENCYTNYLVHCGFKVTLCLYATGFAKIILPNSS